jgi:hypothetical protein
MARVVVVLVREEAVSNKVVPLMELSVAAVLAESVEPMSEGSGAVALAALEIRWVAADARRRPDLLHQPGRAEEILLAEGLSAAEAANNLS